MVIQLVEQVLHNLSEQSSIQDTPVESMKTDKDDEKEMESKTSKSEAEMEQDRPTKLEWKVTPVITRRIQESADNVDR